jgi:hypothetical protein
MLTAVVQAAAPGSYWHHVLCCAVLCCTVLCCAVLCCAVLHGGIFPLSVVEQHQSRLSLLKILSHTTSGFLAGIHSIK